MILGAAADILRQCDPHRDQPIIAHDRIDHVLGQDMDLFHHRAENPVIRIMGQDRHMLFRQQSLAQRDAGGGVILGPLLFKGRDMGTDLGQQGALDVVDLFLPQNAVTPPRQRMGPEPAGSHDATPDNRGDKRRRDTFVPQQKLPLGHARPPDAMEPIALRMRSLVRQEVAMLTRLTAMICAAFPALAHADRAGAQTPTDAHPIQRDTLDLLRWQARPVVVLGQGAATAAQLTALQGRMDDLAERDVVLLTDGPGAEALRDTVGDGFAVLLIGKDGGVKLQRQTPVDPDEIIGLIDTMPMRQREARGD